MAEGGEGQQGRRVPGANLIRFGRKVSQKLFS
jgi:hypothetical protein